MAAWTITHMYGEKLFAWGNGEALGSLEETGPRMEDIREACLEYSGTAANEESVPRDSL